MATVGTGLMTADEFYDFVHRPENQGRFFELENGEVVEMPPPTKIHGFVCGNAAGILWSYAARVRKGYACANDSGVIVQNDPDSVRGPDVCFYLDGQRFETMDRKYAVVPPALVVEVYSPNDNWGKMLVRIEQYLKRGVKAVWVIDPASRTVSVHRQDGLPKVRDDTEELPGEDVLPDFSCPVADFFRLPGETVAGTSPEGTS